MAFGIDQHAPPVRGDPRHTVRKRGCFPFAATTCVDHNGSEFPKDATDKGKFLQVITGHERQIVDLGIDEKSVAPALVLRGQNEGAFGQLVPAAHLLPDPGTPAHRPPHCARVASYPCADRAAPRDRQQGEGGEDIDDRQPPIGDRKQYGPYHQGSLDTFSVVPGSRRLRG